MHERHLPASPNWYCSRCSDINSGGVLGFGAKNTIFLLKVTGASAAVTGELTGHTERVSGFAFCPQDEHICASTSDDKSVKIWDSEQKVLLKEHNVHQNIISAIHWSPLQKHLLLTGDEKGIVVCYWFGRNDTQSFFPEPRTIFCLSCSPHEENYVAVGYKDGIIVLIDISKKGEVVHRLRGHDNEIHALAWCPQPGEEPLYGQPEHNTDMSDELTGADTGCYLASGSRDQTVRIWSTARGKGVMTLKLPFLKRRGPGVDPAMKDRLWLTVHWPAERPSQLVSSCFGGEIVIWNLTGSGKQKWRLLGNSSDGQNHSRIVFNMNSIRLGERELLLSTSMDREIKCWDLESLECCWTLPTLGGFVYCLSFSPVASGCLAVGIGDGMIRVWNTLSIQNPHDIKTFWQGIKSKVTALAWHPKKEGSLAFGTDDGKVGIYDVYSNKPPHISGTYHRRTIYSLSWGPPLPPLSFGDKPSFCLYSCGGDGIIFQHDPAKLSEEASDIDKLIRDTNSIKHKMAPHTDLCWKPDGTLLAIGNEDGSIEVLQAPSLKLLCTVQQHHKIINALRWHHQHSPQGELHFLLASGSSNAVVYVHDLRSAIESPSDSPVLVTEPYRTLSGHTNKITGLAWSPHQDACLVTVCYDGTAQVWDVLKQEPVCNYRGHSGRLLCVQWSSVQPDLVWTGGDDFTLQEWAVSKQKNVTPPKSKKKFDVEKKKKPKKKKASGKGFMKTEDSNLPLVRENKATGDGGVEDGQSDNGVEEEEEEEEKRGPDTSSVTDGSRDGSVDGCGTDRPQNRDKFLHAVKREVREERKSDRAGPTVYSDVSLRKRKPRSILPLSSSMDHRPKEDLQRDCVNLAAVRHQHERSGDCVPGSGDHIQLGLFADRDALYRMFQEEEECHVEAGHYDSVVYLRLWKGDLIGALSLATEKGELTEHLLSLAPMAGYDVWLRTVEAYVKQLCLQEQFLKAASHLVSVHKLYEAVKLLKSHQFYREAIALAKARLQPNDPVLKDLYSSWAAVLEKDGHYASAAKCHLAADSSFDAAKVIAKKGDVMSLRTAASLAWISGDRELAHSLSLRCAKDLMFSQDWAAAQDVLRADRTLLVHQLVLCVHEILTQRLSDTHELVWSPVSSHCWSSPCEENFLSTVRTVWVREFRVEAVDVEKVKLLHQQLKTFENPSTTTNVPIKQLLSYISLDVTLCVLSLLCCDWPSAVKELLRALTRGSEVNHFSLMVQMVQLLLPNGLESVAVYKQKLDPSDEKTLAVSHSLEAFVCYQLLYEKWWSQSANMLPNGHHANPVANGGSDGDAVCDDTFLESLQKVLLSEPHARLQATCRSIANVQSKVTSLIQQHSRRKHSDEAEAASPTSPRDDVPSCGTDESLSSLTSQITELNQSLAAFPESVRKYPFPDVMESCMVVLYLRKHFRQVPQHVCVDAAALLRAHAGSHTLTRAWQNLAHCTSET